VGLLGAVLLGCSSSFQTKSGVGARIETGVDLVEGNEVVVVGVVEGEDERDGILGDSFEFIIFHACGDLAARKVTITIIVETVVALLESDEFAGHDVPLRIGVCHVVVGRACAGGEEEREG
jgi:hypothetical protein